MGDAPMKMWPQIISMTAIPAITLSEQINKEKEVCG